MTEHHITSVAGPEGEITAMGYRSRALQRVRWKDRRISSIETLDARAAGECSRWIAPSLFDVQVNGYAGIDFQQDNLSVDQLVAATRALRQDGCARFFPTLITAEWPKLMERLGRLRALRAKSEDLQRAIAGWHIEGPFLSDKPGYCGAHDPGVMLDPTADHIRELRRAAGDDRVLVTMAPERRGALEAIRLAVSLGITVSLGHSDASAETLRDAVAAGATGFTHLGNGCARQLDRHDNIIWRVCDTDGLTVSLIPDGIHIPAPAFRGLHRLHDRILYTTDAMAAAGAAPGRYRLGSLEVEVGADEIVRQPGQTNFAGSALRPRFGVFRAASMLAQPWQECWHRLSEVPARFVGTINDMTIGQPADFYTITTPAAG